MTHRYEKSGLELLLVTPEILDGCRNIAALCKANHDEHNYDLMCQVVSIMTKYPAVVKTIKEIMALENIAAEALTKSAQYKEQLFPVIESKGKD